MSNISINFSNGDIEAIKKRFSLNHLSDEQALQKAWDLTMNEHMSPAYFSKKLSTLRTQSVDPIHLTIFQKFIRVYESIKCRLGFY